MQRYFVEKEDNGIFTLSNDDSYHVIKVMRMKIGDRVEIVSNRKEYITEIISMDSNVRCKIFSVNEEKVSIIPKVTVAQALVKEQKMDYILQKGTELGLDQILVYQAERSIVKMDKNDKKLDRWSKILKEASEQSKRNNIPLVWFTSLNELIASNYNHKYICSVNEKSISIKNVLSKVRIDDTILFVIGPEGGFSPKEEKLLLDNGFESITFGSNVLRTETASLFVLSAINYEFMR